MIHEYFDSASVKIDENDNSNTNMISYKTSFFNISLFFLKEKKKYIKTI